MSRRALATAAAAAVAIPNSVTRVSASTAVMPDIRRPSTPAGGPGPIATWSWRGAAVTTLGKLETERTADRVGVGQTQRQPLPDAIGLAGLFADQRSRGFVVAEIFAAQVLREQQPVAAQVLDRGEETERLHPGDAAFHQLADLVGQVGGDVAVDRLALGLHRPPLEHRYLLADL